MKQLFIILCFFTLQIVKAQVTEPIEKNAEKSYEYYTLKQHQNKKAARIFLKSGVALIAIGGYVAISGIANSESSASPIGVGIFILGVATTVTSIPLFIVAGNNKRKARLSLKADTVYYGIKGNNFISPSVSFSIPFN